jgi:hypothetical protein
MNPKTNVGGQHVGFTCGAFPCSSGVLSASAAERRLRRVNQGAQGRLDGLLVEEILGDVR